MQYLAESTAATLKGCWYPLQQNLEKMKQTKKQQLFRECLVFPSKNTQKGVVVFDNMPLAERPVTRNCNFWWQGQCSKYLDSPRKTSIQHLWKPPWIQEVFSRSWMNPAPLDSRHCFWILDLESWIRCTLGRVEWQQIPPNKQFLIHQKCPNS